MEIAEYRQRVADEAEALADKLAKLTLFMARPAFVELANVDRALLVEQHTHMSRYLSTLAERMARFREQEVTGI